MRKVAALFMTICLLCQNFIGPSVFAENNDIVLMGIGDKFAHVWDGTSDTSFEDGTGTKNDPYQIATPEQLAYLRDIVNNGDTCEGKYFILTNDLKMNKDSFFVRNSDGIVTSLNGSYDGFWDFSNAGGHEWSTIGESYRPFSQYFAGVFDGNGHIISNLCTIRDGGGLFGQIKNAYIKNVTIDGYFNSKSSIGGIVTSNNMYDVESIIENCKNKCYISGKRVGGIICDLEGDDGAETIHIIKNCTNYGTIHASTLAGGIACEIGASPFAYESKNIANIFDCENYGDIICEGDNNTRTRIAGGIVGISESSYSGGYPKTTSEINIKNCLNYGNVTTINNGDADDVSFSLLYTYATSGGVVGANYACVSSALSTATATVENCYNAGEISGCSSNSENLFVGGVVGYNHSDSSWYKHGGGDLGSTGSFFHDSDTYADKNRIARTLVVNCFNVGKVTDNTTFQIPQDILIRAGADDNVDATLHGYMAGNCIGGVVGKNFSTSYTATSYSYVENCYSRAFVKDNGQSNMGSAIGLNISYLQGKTGCIEENANFMIYDEIADADIKNCYYLNGLGDGYAVGLSEYSMKHSGAYNGFDFSHIWTINSNQEFPYPTLRSVPFYGEKASGITDEMLENGFGTSGNENNPYVTDMQIVHSLPEDINSNIKINQSGTAYAYFILYGTDGEPYANKAVKYILNDKVYNSYRSYTDINGIVAIETESYENKSGKDETKTVKVGFLNEDLSQKDFVFDLTVSPISFKSTWTGKVSKSVGVKWSAGISGGLSSPLGSLESEAELASVGLTDKQTKSFAIEENYTEGKRDLHLTSALDNNLAVKAKVGLYAGIGKKDDIDKQGGLNLGNVSGEASAGYTRNVGLYIENYNADDINQRIKIEAFITDLLLGADNSNVVAQKLYEYIMDKYNIEVKNEDGYNTAFLLKAGAEAPNIEFGSLKASLGGVSTDALYQYGKMTDKDENIANTSSIKATAGYQMGNLSYKRKLNKTASLSANTTVTSGKFLNNSASITTINNKDNEFDSVSMKCVEDSDEVGLFSGKRLIEYYKTISFLGEDASDFISKNATLNKLFSGNFTLLTPLKASQLSDEMTSSDKIGTIKRDKEKTTEFGQELSLNVLGITAGAGLTGNHKYSYTQETGMIQNGFVYKKTDVALDSEMEKRALPIKEILQEIISGIGEDLKDAVKSIAGSVKDGVEWAGGKVKGAAQWAGDKASDAIKWSVSVVTFDKSKIKLQSYYILSISNTDVDLENAAISTTVGEPCIIKVNDENGDDVTDLVDNMLDLTLNYDDDALLEADITNDKETLEGLKIYWWDDNNGIYVRIGGELDYENSCVTCKIDKAGQYILAIDNCPPSVTDFNVSDNTSLPTISALVTDLSGIDNFTMLIDEDEVINKDRFGDYYDDNSCVLEYPVTSPLTDGEHIVRITTSDTIGNVTTEPYIATFDVDTSAPTITHIDVPTFTSDKSFMVSASANDNNLCGLYVQVQYDDKTYSVPMTLNNEEWSAEIDSLPDFASASVTITAYDDAGNFTSTTPQNVIKAYSEDEVYIGILEYDGRTAKILVNNKSGIEQNVCVFLNGFDDNDKLIETTTQSLILGDTYQLIDIKLDNRCYKARAEIAKDESASEFICIGFSAYSDDDGIDITFDDNTKTASITSAEAHPDVHAIIALYDNDVLVEAKTQSLTLNEGDNLVVFDDIENETADMAKIMIWDSLQNMKPICRPFTEELTTE